MNSTSLQYNLHFLKNEKISCQLITGLEIMKQHLTYNKQKVVVNSKGCGCLKLIKIDCSNIYWRRIIRLSTGSPD